MSTEIEAVLGKVFNKVCVTVLRFNQQNKLLLHLLPRMHHCRAVASPPTQQHASPKKYLGALDAQKFGFRFFFFGGGGKIRIIVPILQIIIINLVEVQTAKYVP